MQHVELIKGADIFDLKEVLGISALDLGWVTGLKNTSSAKDKWKMSGDRSELPITQPYLSILVRYLMKHGDESMRPRMPYFEDVYEKIAEHFKKLGYGKFSYSRLGLILGLNKGAVNQWKGTKEPVLAIQRLLFIINQAIDKYGEEGLRNYMKVVEEELRLRELGTVNELFLSNSWVPNSFANRYKDPSVPVPEGLLTGADFNDLRENLGLDWWDFIWLTGRSRFLVGWKPTGQESLRPRTRPSTCLLVRYLMNHFEDNFVPTMPDHEEVYDLVSKVNHPFKKMSARVVGPLFGVTGWSFNQWRKIGTQPKPMVSRLFFLLKKAIENDGQKGFDRYFEVVKEDILARGLGDYDYVVQKGWGAQELKKKYYQ